MKIKSLVTAVLFTGAVMSGAAYADDKVAAPKAAEAQTGKSAVKPHSHVQDKTGIPQSMPDAKADKPNASKDQSKHYHPRDGK